MKHSFDNRRVWWLAIALTVAFPIYDGWALGLGYDGFFRLPRGFAGAPAFALRMLGLLSALAVQAVTFRAALLAPLAWRVGFAAFLALATFIEYGYVGATGLPMNTDDVRIALESVFFWGGEIRTFVNWWAVGPAIGFAVTCFAVTPAVRGHLRRLSIAVLATFILHSAWAARSYARRDQSIGVNADTSISPIGMPQALARAATMTGWRVVADRLRYQHRDAVNYHASTAPNHHVVFVIDESVTAGHMSLNGYRRTTTPWLESLAKAGRISNWGIAAAAATYSDASVYCLLTGVTTLPDHDRLGFRTPTLFQYARAMNYQTHLFEGQGTARRFGLSAEDLTFVDDWRTANQFGNDFDTDVRMARAVSEVLAMPAGQFVVILKRGNHLPHVGNYPTGTGLWYPAYDKDVPSDAEIDALTNTYDNGLAYNVDHFFRALLREDGSLPRTVLLYTSDHGEVLGGEGTRPLSRGFDWGILAVPMFLMGDNRPPVDTQYRPSHHNAFATVLDLLSFPVDQRPLAYGRSLLTAQADDHDSRIVFTGLLSGDESFALGDFDRIQRPAILQ